MSNDSSPSPEGDAASAPEEGGWQRQCVFWGTTAIALGYFIAVVLQRFDGAFGQYAANHDQRQAVWHYYRYTVEGAFPPGDLLTEYAFNMHAPPLWWLMMATLSQVMLPLKAAKIINLFAFGGTAAASYAVVRSRSNHVMALVAAGLLLHSMDFHVLTAGGYARSFGPMLGLSFLASWLWGCRRLTLIILFVQGLLYPPVLLPCGLAYGIWTMFAGPWEGRVRRVAQVAAVGIACLLVSYVQESRVPESWGGVVTLEEAKAMPSWSRSGGRFRELPLYSPGMQVWRNFIRSFQGSGRSPLPKLKKWSHTHDQFPMVILLLIAAIYVFIRNRQFPPEICALTLAAFGAYLVARAVAFRFYIPYRPLSHIIPYVVYCSIPLLSWRCAEVWFSKFKPALTTPVAAALVIVPVWVFTGDGVSNTTGNAWHSYRGQQSVHEFLASNTNLDTVIAADLFLGDRIPTFGHRQVYINKVLAHPFRRGFFNEATRRIAAQYVAIYSDNWDEVITFARREKIDYFALSDRIFTRMDDRLFRPVRKKIRSRFNDNRGRFVLAKPPKGSVVFRGNRSTIIDVRKLPGWGDTR